MGNNDKRDAGSDILYHVFTSSHITDLHTSVREIQEEKMTAVMGIRLDGSKDYAINQCLGILTIWINSLLGKKILI